MGFVPWGEQADVTLAVIAYGATPRLRACLDSLTRHESTARFAVAVVLNPDERDREPDTGDLAPGIKALTPDANLGWAGGLHLVRSVTSTPWMVWVQDDSEILPGYLDAHMAAAAEHPRVGAFGAVAVDADGRPSGYSGGRALPPDDVSQWNLTDPTLGGEIPATVESREWITSKGMLVRMEAWDEVGGPCARQYPLNHVDKEFSLHLRAHGWELAVVPGAQLLHLQSQSAPSLAREFIAQWHHDAFGERWAGPAQAMAGGGGPVAHDCHVHPDMATIERECLREASRMLVPLGKFASPYYMRALDTSEVDGLRRELAEVRNSTSWKVTAPLRAASGLVRRLLRR